MKAAAARPAPEKVSPIRKPSAPLPPVARTRAGRWVILHALGVGIAVSFWGHGLLASLGFIVPPPEVRKRDEGLRVVLVNAKHAQASPDAKLLAQNNLAGGGTTEDKNLPTSPLPPETREQGGEALLETRQKQIEQMEALQRELLTQARNNAAVELSRRQTENQPKPEAADGTAAVDQQRAIARQQAIVEKKLQEYAQRPRKQFIGPSTKEYRFALYEDSWRQRMEKVGTLHYPKEALTRPYSLLVSIEIRADGGVANVDIMRSSGNKRVDDAALRIIQLASPFAPFPKDIRRDTDVLVLTRTWTFSGEQMRAER